MGSPADVEIDYTNWKGNRRSRSITPRDLWWGQTEYHKGFQWLLTARDLETGELRDFAMTGIHSWRALPESSCEHLNIKGNDVSYCPDCGERG